MDPITQAAWATLSRAPMMRIAVPFILGIVVAMWFPATVAMGAVALVLTTIAAIIVMRRHVEFPQRWVRGPFVFIWFFVFGWFWQTVRDPLQHPLHFSHQGPTETLWVMQLNTINGSSAKIIRADATVQQVGQGETMKPSNGKVMMTLLRHDDGSEPRAGDILIVRTRMEPITRIPDPGGFDRRSWAASRGMYHECFAGPEQWMITGHGWRWSDLFLDPRIRVSEWLLESGLPLRERAMVKALVLGMRDELDGAQREAFVRSGTIHILAVSGTHVGFIYLMLLFMFRWWGGGHKARLVRGLIILIALWSYAGLTGGSPSVLRATIMFTLFTLAGMSSQRASPLNSLFAAAFILLLWDPHMLVEIGFQLSFLAVLGIILFHAPIERKWVPDNVWVGRIWTLSVMSIAAQLLTTPLTLYFFKAFPTYFLPANLFVVTAAGFAVYGAVGMLVVFRIPLLGPLVAFLLMALLMAVGHVTEFFSGLPGAYPAVRIGIPEVFVLYALVISTMLALVFKWRPAVRVAGVAMACLLVAWGYRSRASQAGETFVVYDDRHALQATLSVGRSLIVITDDDIQEISDWTRKKLDRHQRSTGSNDPIAASFASLVGKEVVQVGPTVMGGGRWSSQGLDVRFFSEDDPVLPASDPIDVLVIHDLRYISEEVLGNISQHAKQVVLAGDLAWKARAFAKKWCGEHALPVHDVRDQGAFILAKN